MVLKCIWNWFERLKCFVSFKFRYCFEGFRILLYFLVWVRFKLVHDVYLWVIYGRDPPNPELCFHMFIGGCFSLFVCAWFGIYLEWYPVYFGRAAFRFILLISGWLKFLHG